MTAPPRSPAKRDWEEQHGSYVDRRGPCARGPAGACGRGRHRAARHGLVPRRRPDRRGQRQAGAGDRADPRRPAVETRPQRGLHGRADVRAVLSAQAPQGQAAAVDVARRRPHRRDLRNHAGRPRRLAQPVRPQGLGRLRLRCGRARPRRLREPGRVAVRADFFELRRPVRTLPHRRRPRFLELRSG